MDYVLDSVWHDWAEIASLLPTRTAAIKVAEDNMAALTDAP